MALSSDPNMSTTGRRGFIVAALGGFAAVLGLRPATQWLGNYRVVNVDCGSRVVTLSSGYIPPMTYPASARWSSATATLGRGDVFTVSFP